MWNNKKDERKTYLFEKTTCVFEKLENLPFEVFIKLRYSYIPLNIPILKSIALKISDKFVFETSKIQMGCRKFSKEGGINFKYISGESICSETSFGKFENKFGN